MPVSIPGSSTDRGPGSGTWSRAWAFCARLHVAVSPEVELGAGSRLRESPADLLARFHRDAVSSPMRSDAPPVLAAMTPALLSHVDDDFAFGPSLFNEIQSVLR